ncbi:MAG: T9SS type A sorting domain-containing protein [Sphingobacteriaceae bacterium]|nr:T9SS type A sorting domain-containing protein [Sphingobacteriaceae bacterium]
MIKKLLMASLLIGGLAAKAQNKVEPEMSSFVNAPLEQSNTQSVNKTSVVNITDTLLYFLNKNEWKYGNSYLTVKTPHTGSVQVNTEFGSSFLNTSGTPVTITKALVLASRQANSTSTMIPLTVTLYTASPTGVPGASITTATCAITSTAGQFGTFATFTAPVVASGAFFLSYRANPINPADTLRVFFTAAHTATSGAPATQKFGESLGFIRNNGNLISTTNYYNTGTPGSDLEAVVVPFVSFNFTADANVSAPNSTATPGAYCANLGITYTNTTSEIANNRQFNYNAFATYWAPKTGTMTTPAVDPVYNWSFNGPPTPTGSYTTANVTHTYATAGNASADIIVKYMYGFSKVGKTLDTKTWTLQIANCGIVGVAENQLNANLNVYPNPAISGKVNISGLEGSNTITVYNSIGQLVSTLVSETEITTVDLSAQPTGAYLIRVTDSNKASKVVRVINE